MTHGGSSVQSGGGGGYKSVPHTVVKFVPYSSVTGSCKRGIPAGGTWAVLTVGARNPHPCRTFTRTGLIFKKTDRPLSCVFSVLRKRGPTARNPEDRARIHARPQGGLFLLVYLERIVGGSPYRSQDSAG